MDTGRAGSIGGINADQLLKKSYFAAHGLLPANKFYESLHELPTLDFSFPNSGTITQSRSRVEHAVVSSPSNFGWNLDAAYTKVLFILGMSRVRPHRLAPCLYSATPSNNGATNADKIGVVHSAVDGKSFIFKVVSGGFTELANNSEIYGQAQPYEPNTAFALYYDQVAAEAKCFYKYGDESWFPIYEVAAGASRPASISAVGLDVDGLNGAKQYVGCPLGVYVE